MIVMLIGDYADDDDSDYNNDNDNSNNICKAKYSLSPYVLWHSNSFIQGLFIALSDVVRPPLRRSSFLLYIIDSAQQYSLY